MATLMKEFSVRYDRQAEAVNSQNRYLARRRNSFAKEEIEIEQAMRTADPAERERLQEKLAKLQKDRDEFNQAILYSSLRQATPDEHKDNKDTDTFFIEERISRRAPSSGTILTKANLNQKGQMKLSGAAAVFDKLSLNLGGWRERFECGAMTEALKAGVSDVRGLLNHNADLLFARSTAGTLRLHQTPNGLEFYADLLDADALTDCIVSRVARRDLTQCSFSFTVAEDTWHIAKKQGETDIRVIKKIQEIFDVSLSVYPAYPQTSVEVLFEQQRNVPTEKQWRATQR